MGWLQNQSCRGDIFGEPQPGTCEAGIVRLLRTREPMGFQTFVQPFNLDQYDGYPKIYEFSKSFMKIRFTDFEIS